MVTAKRRVEIFRAGCSRCDDVVRLVSSLVCPSCELQIYDRRDGCATDECRDKARRYGISVAPPIAVNGVVLDRCRREPISTDLLRAAGIGRPVRESVGM
jgi:hypothetical protein